MKRLISCFLAIILAFSVVTFPAYGAETESSIPSDAEIQAYGLNFMNKSQNRSDLAVKDFLHLYDTSGQLTGFYLTFCTDTEDAGYLLLSLISGEDPVVEFAFEGDGIIPAESTQASENGIATQGLEEKNAQIIYTGPGEIFVPTEDSTYYAVYDQEYVQLETDDVAVYSNDITTGGGIINWDDAYLDTNSVFKIKDFGSGADYWIIKDFNQGGACYPTAATNILWYWGFKRQCTSITNQVQGEVGRKAKATSIFNTLHTAMLTFDPAGTFDGMILQGYKTFFHTSAETGGVWNYRKIKKTAAFSEYKTALNDDCPIQLVLHTKSGTINRGDGHGVMVLGYACSQTNSPYLFVMDGWYNYGRFLKFNYYPQIFGYKIWVSGN